MERTKNEVQNLNSFLKFLSVHYKDQFAEELNNLGCAVDEIQIKENNQSDYWYIESVKLKNENDMLRKDLMDLSKGYFKK